MGLEAVSTEQGRKVPGQKHGRQRESEREREREREREKSLGGYRKAVFWDQGQRLR